MPDAFDVVGKAIEAHQWGFLPRSGGYACSCGEHGSELGGGDFDLHRTKAIVEALTAAGLLVRPAGEDGCEAITGRGYRCTRRAKPGTRRCAKHQPGGTDGQH